MPLTVQFSSQSVITPETTDAILVELVLKGVPVMNANSTMYSVNVSTQPGTARGMSCVYHSCGC